MKTLKFKEIFKEKSGAVDEIFKDDATFVYQKRIMAEKDSLLPILNKVVNKKLILKDYTLNSGHCLALAEVWNKIGEPEVEIIYLDNCGVDDEEFSSLLEGFYKQKCLRLLYYKENVLGENSMRAIKPLLLKRYPNHLRQLKLVKL